MLLSQDRPYHADVALTTNGHSTVGMARRVSQDACGDIHGPSVPVHPLGIKPLGNQYFHVGSVARNAIGTLQTLSDELLVEVLELLDEHALRILGYTCKFLFAHSISDELWRALFLESKFYGRSDFNWLGTWRATLLELPDDRKVKIDCSYVFSDVLHRPFVCSHLDLSLFTSAIPASNRIRHLEDLSYDEFAAKWSNRPFILTKPVRAWPAFQTWSLDHMLQKYGHVEFRAEALDWTYATYHQYVLDNQDESPLYLFDSKFAEKMCIQVGKHDGAAYWKPECFGPDLFEHLRAERPAHRWLIIGPVGSGSTFHKDPNGTSAWNAVLRGAKYWVMFPPDVSVPGVYVSHDNSEVTSPLSIAEWLLEFHGEARQLPECQEGICAAGEILHVPSGWWHLVVNLESGIALTQNFVSTANLADVMSFLRDRAEQVTGFKKDVGDPYELFVRRLREADPELLEQSLLKLDLKQVQKKRWWHLAREGAEEGQPSKKSIGFTFGFSVGDDEEEAIS